jgi:hypothetical protein
MDLSLWWVLPARREQALGQRVIRALSMVPEARPRLFGDAEPPRQPLPPDDDAPFLALWREEVASGGMVIWKGTSPFRGGWVSFPSRREETLEGLRGHEKAVSLDVEVRPSGYTEPERREALVKFFVTVADRLGAVYASAGLADQAQPEAGVDQSLVRLDGTTLVHGVWIGLPPVRNWLHWFGPPYIAELSGFPGVEKLGGGLLLRRGGEPAMRGEQPGPALPASLCWRARTLEEKRAYQPAPDELAYEARVATAIAQGIPRPPPRARRITDRVPAEVLPEIGAAPAGRSRPRSTAPVQRRQPRRGDAPPRLLWKDEDGPGWPGGGHPERVGPAWIERENEALEELNEGAWITRAEAERLAAEGRYTFQEV